MGSEPYLLLRFHSPTTEKDWAGAGSAIIAKSLQVRQANAAAHPQNRQAGRLALSLHKQGLSLQQIATELNEAGFRTRRGQTFFKRSVQRRLKREQK